MRLGIFTNTLSTRNEGLTTHDIGFGAALRGHEVFMIPVTSLSYDGKTITGKGPKLNLGEINTREAMTRNLKNFPFEKVTLESLDVLLLRHKYEPGRISEVYHKYAREYAFHLQEKGVYVANDPKYLPFLSTKLSALGIDPSILPEKSIVSSDYEELLVFCKETLNFEGVMKPLGGKGGEDIYFTEKRNLRNNLKSLLKKGPVMVQNFIPNDGDKRILLLNGEPIAWYKRVALDGEFINNIHAGGRPVSFDLTERDKVIIQSIGPRLVQYGMVLVGLDILGNYLSEINSEVPGGTVRADKLGNFKSREKIVRFFESKGK
jgi:glutathione synthase